MRTEAVVSALLCLCSLGAAQLTLQTCGDENSAATCSFFFRKVDEAFRQENVLYTLRKAFFPSEGSAPFLFDVEMTLEIETVPDIRCDDEKYAFGDSLVSSPPPMDQVCGKYQCGLWQLGWTHQWSKTIISYIIEREDLELLQDTNFVSFAAATFNSFDTSVFSNDDAGLQENSTNSSAGATTEHIVQFQLTIPYLPCRPDDGLLLDAWEDILPWLQLYSQNSDSLQLEEVEYSQETRGFAFREGRIRNGGITVPMLAVIHILLNVVFALGATYFLHKYHGYLNQVKGKQYQLVASMYWSVVFVSLMGAVVIIVGNCYLYYALIFIDDRSLSVFGFRISSDGAVAILAVVELVASMLTPHDPDFFIPYLIRRILCFNQCCRCCGSQTRLNFMRRAVLGLAMWVIILFLQLVIASLLPLAVVVVVNPVPSLAFVSIMVALFFCLVIFVAYFLNAFEGNYIGRHRLSREQRRVSKTSWGTLKKDWNKAGDWAKEKLILMAQAFVFLVIFVIVALVIILYLNFVRAGANTNTIGGLFISLVPSAILGGITWAAKKHLFKELEEEIEAEKEEEEGEMEENEEDTLFKFGGFSFQPRRRKTTKRKKTITENGHAPASVNPLDKEASPSRDHERDSETAIEIDQPGDTTQDTHDVEEGAEGTDYDQKDRKEASEDVEGQEKGEEEQVEEKEKLGKTVSIDVQMIKVPFLRTMQTIDVNDESMV